MANLFPSNDKDFTALLGNFIAVAGANMPALSLLSAADLATLTDAHADMQAKIADEVTKREAAKASTAAAATARQAATDTLRGAIRKVQAITPAISNELVNQLGMNVRDTTRTPVIPVAPVGLIVNGLETGSNMLKWKTGGNKAGTTYIIEARVGAETAFSFVGTVSRTDYAHKGQTPGVKAAYRIKATRPVGQSAYSNVAVVYDAS